MTKKKLLWIPAGIFGFLILGGISLFAFLSYKIRDIKEPLLKALQSHIDGRIEIGNADVVMFPTGIDLENVTLYAPDETEPSAKVKRAEIRFNLIPLLRKKFETRLTVVEPIVRLHRDKSGTSNFERIFRPLMGGEQKSELSSLDRLWWRQLAVDELIIQNASFTSTAENKEEKSEWKNIHINAQHIRFESIEKPADLKVRFELPQISSVPMEFATKMIFDESNQKLVLKDGNFTWGATEIRLHGEAQTPLEKRQDIALNLTLESNLIDLKKLGQNLHKPLPASGKMSLSGSVEGSPFAPALRLHLTSPSLIAGGKSLSAFQADVVKRTEPIELIHSSFSFGIYQGTVQAQGKLYPGVNLGADLQVTLNNLSLAAAAGKKDNPARLSGKLQISSKNFSNPAALSGGGEVTVGPIPLPSIDMKSKMQMAEILAAGTNAGRLINLGMLSSSQNVIGTTIPLVRARVKIAGNNITLTPFAMENGHFNASGNGTIFNQKTIQASGTFVLNSQITAQLLPDRNFRQFVTNGKGALSLPFTVGGPLDNPSISVDSDHFRAMIVKATAMGLTNILAGGLKPDQMLGTALKNSPLSDPKNPLSQIFGNTPLQQNRNQNTAATAMQKRTATQQTTTQRTPTQQRRATQKTRSTTGHRTLDQLLLGR